jgi:hypothetical protein
VEESCPASKRRAKGRWSGADGWAGGERVGGGGETDIRRMPVNE